MTVADYSERRPQQEAFWIGAKRHAGADILSSWLKPWSRSIQSRNCHAPVPRWRRCHSDGGIGDCNAATADRSLSRAFELADDRRVVGSSSYPIAAYSSKGVPSSPRLAPLNPLNDLLLDDSSKVDASLSVAQQFDDGLECRRVLSPAWIIEVKTRRRRTPLAEYLYQCAVG